MASSLNYNRAATGSVTNTLGTLGRSLFNSTIGTYADSETMNQIYSTVSKLTNSIETTSKTIDNEALTGRNKADDLYTLIAGMDIKSSYDFMNKNREFMKRLMRLNKQEKDITLNALGVDVSGNSHTITNEYVKDYDHVRGNNYLEDYVKTLPQNQQIGDETTTLQLESSTNFNYAGIHNDLYTVNQNLYPDDDNKGSFSNKWITENQNSLMYKTKKLFNSKKIGTLISRFHTDPNRGYSAIDNARSKYGLSHGRNLLTKSAETGANRSYVGNYDNPYCRVWTHYHQYDRLYKTIRPFSTIDDYGEYSDSIKVKDFHEWPQFSDSSDTNSETQGKWGWKKNSNNGWQYSVLQDNGLVNITPKYVEGGASNIHTKQCMFSIENLAWKGYDPYSFEQALSWEQRGPLGGRIMWFPPYGIQFNETTTTQWANTTFLGRGEDVYTYTNTTRTGTLSFKMVVDHPSLIDYVTWKNTNKNVTDTDILRYFAGCGEGDGEGLRKYAKPTPLTDEYTQKHNEIKDVNEVLEVIENNPENEKSTDTVISFYVFYPNNYSGTYDDKNCDGGEGYKKDPTSKVEAIPYLLAGEFAQKLNCDNQQEPFAQDKELTEDVATWNGCGYEMEELEKKSGVIGCQPGKTRNLIKGTDKYDNKIDKNGNISMWSGASTQSEYKVSNNRKWFYRIDGRYKVPLSEEEKKINFYNQKLETGRSHVKNCFGLNKNIDVLAQNSNNQIIRSDDDYITANSRTKVYTLAEMAYALYSYGNGTETESQKYLNLKEDVKNSKRMQYLLATLKGQEVKSISGRGTASKQGFEELNKKLAENRFKTAAHWFQKHAKCSQIQLGACDIMADTQGTMKDKVRSGGNNSTRGDSDEIHSILWRCARVDITFDTASTSTAAEASATTDVSSSSPSTQTQTNTQSDTTDSQKADQSAKNIAYGVENVETERESENNTGGNKKTETGVKNDSKESSDTSDKKTSGEAKEAKIKNLTANYGGNTDVTFNPTSEIGYCSTVKKNLPIYKDGNGKKWYYDKDSKKLISVEYESEVDSTPQARYGGDKTDENRLRYDQEYHFFKVLEQKDPIVFNSLMDKLKYFDPAFHSMTPEGFNGRLTFLQQCMRQGNTVSASDGRFSKSANNLAFGRAPYCVLRLGDFYNQMIVIDNLSISYDPLVWDLNVEGIGVQPLIANVQLSFKFVGGGDLTGPVRRLQNAMSFNYYANARLYDNRADRVERRWSDKTCGALEHDEILSVEGEAKMSKKYDKKEKRDSSYSQTYNANGNMSQFYSTQMYK
jgi:hypothetical protein